MTAVAFADGSALTWEQYAALGEDVRAEFIDGHLVMSPSPTRQHQSACRRLANTLEDALAGDATADQRYAVAVAWAWKPAADEFIPDVMVFPETDESVRFTGRPALVVEVLSTNRGDDLVVKTSKYAALGLEHYWVVDPRDGVLDAFALARTGAGPKTYHRVQRLDQTGQAGPIAADLSFGIATARVDLSELLA